MGSVVSLTTLDFEVEDDELGVLDLPVEDDEEVELLDLLVADDDAVLTGAALVELFAAFGSDLLLVVTGSGLDGLVIVEDVDDVEDDFLLSIAEMAMKPSVPPLRTLYQPSFLPITSILAPGFRCASVR